MSSSRPSDTGTELPDHADLPDADGAIAPDLFSEGVGFRDDDTGEYAEHDAAGGDRARSSAATPGHDAGHDAGHDGGHDGGHDAGHDGARDSWSPASSSSSVRQRLADAWDRTRPWSA